MDTIPTRIQVMAILNRLGLSPSVTRGWHDAFVALAHDAPAIMLYAPDNVAAVDKRVMNVRLRADDWWAYLRTWRVPPDKLTDRDRLGH